MSNILMQVESEKDLIKWNDWFNTRVHPSSITNLSASPTINKEEGETFLDPSQQSKFEHKNDASDNQKKAIKRLTRQSRLDSGITTHHLLAGEEEGDDDNENGLDRRGSEMTDETIDCCYSQPILSDSEYGIHEILTAREAQAHQHQLSSIEQGQEGAISSFYSFADYFPTPAATANANSEATVTVPEDQNSNM